MGDLFDDRIKIWRKCFNCKNEWSKIEESGLQ
jgi:hypothetical protein